MHFSVSCEALWIAPCLKVAALSKAALTYLSISEIDQKQQFFRSWCETSSWVEGEFRLRLIDDSLILVFV